MLMAGLSFVKAYLGRFIPEDSGQDFVEYALIIGVISLVIVFLFMTAGLGPAVEALVNDISCALSNDQLPAAGGTC